MQVRFNNPRLRNARDIENAQAALIVQKRIAHEELPGCKNLLHIPDMFAKKGELNHCFHGLLSWARGIDHGKHSWLSFANHCCTSWYKVLRSSP
jgi:hypothetical protein